MKGIAYIVRADLPLAIAPTLPATILIDEPFEWAPRAWNAVGAVSFKILEGTPLSWFVPQGDAFNVSATPVAVGVMNDVVLQVVDAMGRRAVTTLRLEVLDGPVAINLTKPKIVGIPRVGEEYYYSWGRWGGLGSENIMPKWQRSSDGETWEDIAGAAGNTYTPTVGDIGYQLSVIEAPDGEGEPCRSRPSQFICAQPVATHFVDFDSGDDSNAGTSIAAPWKHAPGDADASGNALAYVATPGDVIALKGGARYPNTLHAIAAGGAKAPLTYAGNLWGAKRAILDMGVQVNLATQVRAATDKADAGGVENWADVSVLEDASIVKGQDFWLLDNVGGLLYPGRYPAAVDPFFVDTARYNDVEFIRDGMGDTNLFTIDQGYITSSLLEARLTGQVDAAILAIWWENNLFTYRRDAILSGGGRIDIEEAQTNPKWKVNHKYEIGRAFVWNDRHSVTSPGFFAVIEDGKAIFIPRAGATKLSILQSKPCINYNNKDFVHFDGFTLTGVMASGSKWSVPPVINRISTYGSSASSGAPFSGGGLFNTRIQDCVQAPSSMRVFVVAPTAAVDFTIMHISSERIVFMGGVEYGGTTGFRGRYMAAKKLSGGGIRAAGADQDSLFADVIGTEMSGVHANWSTHYSGRSGEADDARLERVAAYGLTRPYTAQGKVMKDEDTGEVFETVRAYLEYRNCIGIPDEEGLNGTTMRLDALMHHVWVSGCHLVSHKGGIGHAGSNWRYSWFIDTTTYGSLRLSTYWDVQTSCVQIAGAANIDNWIAAQTLTPRYVKTTGEQSPADVIEVDLQGKVPEEEML